MTQQNSESGRPRVACILNGILGNRAFSLKLADSVDAYLGGQTPRFWFDDSSYAAYPAPRLLRFSSELEAGYVARRFLDSISGPFDTYVINGHVLAQEIVPVFSRRFPGSRFVVALDATPAAIDRTPKAESGGIRALSKRLLRRRQHAAFAAMSRSVAAWLPICRWVKDSLVDDYGVPAERCFVTGIPQPRHTDDARQHSLHSPLRLLFVGNDLLRKGGGLLVDLVRRSPDRYALTIVSNDPAANEAVGIDGVVLRQGLRSAEEVAVHYREADLLVLPTRMDCYPNVICEGLSYGLPFVATGINGIADLIEESGAGVAIGWPPDLSALEDAISDATSSSEYFASLSTAATQYAARCLTLEAFRKTVESSLSAGSGAQT